MAAEGEDNELNRPGPSRRAGKLFLGGVGYETSEAALQKHFSQYGDLLEVVGGYCGCDLVRSAVRRTVESTPSCSLFLLFAGNFAG